MRAFLFLAALSVGCATQSQAVKTAEPAPATPSPAPPAPRAFTADLVGEGDQANEMLRHVTVVGEKVRVDMEGNGRKSTQLYRGPDQTLLVLDTDARVVHEMKLNPFLQAAAKMMEVDDLAHPCPSAEAACTRVGVEQLEGRPVTRWKTTGSDGGPTSYLVDESLHYLLRIERTKGAIGLKNLKLITPDDTLFAAPADYTVAAPRK